MGSWPCSGMVSDGDTLAEMRNIFLSLAEMRNIKLSQMLV
jgi:hypothetical protein